MCQPLSKGGKRCANHARKKTEKLVSELNALKEENESLASQETLSNEQTERKVELETLISRKSAEVDRSRLEYAGTYTGQKELREAIKKAKEEGDTATAQQLSDYAAEARRNMESLVRKNIREHKRQVYEKELREEYLPEVYRKYEGDNSPVPSAYSTYHINKQKEVLANAESPQEASEAQAKLAEMEAGHRYYTEFLRENYGEKGITFDDVYKAERAAEVAREEHGRKSAKARAAVKNLKTLRRAEIFQSRIAQYKADTETEIVRQQEALRRGVLLRDAKFSSDLDRQISPHGVERRDVGRASVTVEKARRVYGEDSEQYAVATKRLELVKRAYQKRREISKQELRMDIINGIRSVFNKNRDTAEAAS